MAFGEANPNGQEEGFHVNGASPCAIVQSNADCSSGYNVVINGLECVINISEGISLEAIDKLARSCQGSLLDIHADKFHNRSVFTLFGNQLNNDVRQLTQSAIEWLDITHHQGVHPRIGVVDVVPFCPLGSATMQDAIIARDEYANWLWDELSVPSFLYGTERTLPEIRKLIRDGDFKNPDVGHGPGHSTAGFCAVGARLPLVAYNLTLNTTFDKLRAIAREIRCASVRSLALIVNNQCQLSLNLIEPELIGPLQIVRNVKNTFDITSTELVGLIPESVLESYTPSELIECGIEATSTIEYRVSHKTALPSPMPQSD